MEHLKPLRLRCFVQNYDWGRSGEESTVAKLFSLNSNSMIDPDKPYAELWMGTHESGPSFLAGSETDGLDGVGGDGMCAVSLKSWIDENAGAVGEKVVEKWGRDLPFLFKVLSVAKALSIQAHPDKELARVLHKSRPNIYKDANHKPEMAVALTEFGALCGFISLEELKGVLVGVPEVVDLVGHAEVDQVLNIKEQDGEEKAKAVLRSIFTQLMSAGKDAVFEAVAKLKSRLNTENKVRVLSEKEQLVLLLEKQYPSDVGVISAFFFNFVKLNPGEALYLGANEPHAYIYGECIECMATSDNVVRAGLTPKYRDVQTLCSMLTYKQGFPEILHGIPVSPYTRRYLPPFDEFEVDHCCLPTGASAVFPASPGPSIFVVIAGEGSMQTGLSGKDAMITDGDVFFIPAECEISITAAFGDDFTSGTLQLYRAGVNSRCFK
ncbi:mannose-6-phosphate isomerase 2 isoform X1 [Magnolia sinica]|uniref:mannose-6-phosphate isomerase 2 isoform X1 n=1 Tax=Magnolia sinica TaxID=86752 RepID=UPI00265976DD|nr:mannose-6-phosphate isomerase 2 isoform X1 [Magnolia sinica]